MVGFDAWLRRVLHRSLLALAVGIPGLLLGLGPRPERSDSVFGLIVVLAVVLPAATTVWRLPPRARSALPSLSRHRPLAVITAGLLACATVLVGWWAATNAIFPGTFSPLALAFCLTALAGGAALIGRATR